MSIREECPIEDEINDALIEAGVIEKPMHIYIDLPDRWFGVHQDRRDAALLQAEKYGGDTLKLFAMSLASLDNWSLPGLAGNPEQWDFLKLDLRLIFWVNNMVQAAYFEMRVIPKKSLPPSANGSTAEAVTSTDGSSETTTQ